MTGSEDIPCPFLVDRDVRNGHGAVNAADEICHPGIVLWQCRQLARQRSFNSVNTTGRKGRGDAGQDHAGLDAGPSTGEKQAARCVAPTDFQG